MYTNSVLSIDISVHISIPSNMYVDLGLFYSHTWIQSLSWI